MFFSHDEGERFKPFGMRTIINRIRTKAGINFTAHALRKTFAKQAVLNIMGIEFVQQLMGHESIEMTRHNIGLLDVQDLVKCAINIHQSILTDNPN
jgi:integrase